MGGPHAIARAVQRPMPMAGIQRMQVAYNMAHQAGMGGGMNPGSMPMQRGVANQAHQQQQQQVLYMHYICTIYISFHGLLPFLTYFSLFGSR